MPTVQELEIHCGTCGYWIPAVGPEPTSDAATMIGTVVQCRKCLQRTTCAPENMRVRAEGGGYVHWPTA